MELQCISAGECSDFLNYFVVVTINMGETGCTRQQNKPTENIWWINWNNYKQFSNPVHLFALESSTCSYSMACESVARLSCYNNLSAGCWAINYKIKVKSFDLFFFLKRATASWILIEFSNPANKGRFRWISMPPAIEWRTMATVRHIS